MRKDVAKRHNGSSVVSNPLQILENRQEIEAGLKEKINSAIRLDEEIQTAATNQNEWALRFQVASQLLSQDPDNGNLRTLAEQAQIHLGLTIKKLEALHEEQVQSNRTRAAALESMKQLQRIELLQVSGAALQGHRNELTEIMTRTAQLELAAPEANREALRSEYYMQALLELSMERMR